MTQRARIGRRRERTRWSGAAPPAVGPQAVFALVCCLVAPLLNGQEAPPIENPQAGPPASASEVVPEPPPVEIDVVVRGPEGPVGGLGREDFRVLEDGAPRPVVSFVVDSSKGFRRAAAPLGPAEVANRVNPRGQVAYGATVILLDLRNAAPAARDGLEEQVRKYIASLAPGDQYALFSLSGRLDAVQDVTGDPAALIRTARGDPAGFALTLASAGLMDELVGGAAPLPRPPDTAPGASDTQRIETTTAALEEFARHLAGLPGRKQLVWIGAAVEAASRGPGSPAVAPGFGDLRLGRMIQRTVRALNDANVAVYPVLAGNSPGGDARSPGAPNLTGLIATGTGGRVVTGTGIAEAIRGIQTESSLIYRLGFHPAGPARGGDHTLAVEMAATGSDPAIQLLYRGAYSSVTEPLSDPQLRRLVEDAFDHSLEATGIGMRAAVTAHPTDPDLRQLELTIDLNDFEVVEERRSSGSEFVAILAMATRFEPRDRVKEDTLPGDQQGQNAFEEFRIALEQDRYQAALANGMRIPRLIDTRREPGTLHIVVQDRRTGKLGSLRVPVEWRIEE